MLRTRIEFVGNRPFVSVNGQLHYPLAYTTYFEECGEFADFINSGYRMFFVNVSFTTLPINNMTGFSPFRTGVFEGETPDYSEFEYHVRRILDMCPDALIFPRINVAMPEKWVNEHPYETVVTPIGGRRESLFSDLYRKDGAVLLKTLVEHIRNSDYADRIAGYQICGGLTQEWMHHDFFGSFSEMGLEKFREWMKEKYSVENAPVPEREDFNKGIFNDTIRNYADFCCEAAAKTAEHFVKELKSVINNEQIAGIFYGYSAFVNDYLMGLHGLRHIIASPYIDFFSSPCAYDDVRRLGIDWGDMIPVDSLKAHGKLAFIECDIRTHLTKSIEASRPDEYPRDVLKFYDINKIPSVWKGPDTHEHSVSAIRKTFAHQLTKASGIWWFDMWGGWYHDERLMNEISRMRCIADASADKNENDFPKAQVAVFVDEEAIFNLARSSPLCGCATGTRKAMSLTGIPFDLYLATDAADVISGYSAAIFPSPFPSENGRKAIELCERMNIPHLRLSEEKTHFTVDELRDRLTENGIHCFNPHGNTIYCGNGYVGIHTSAEGETEIRLPEKFRIKPLFSDSDDTYMSDRIIINAKKFDTFVLELNKI